MRVIWLSVLSRDARLILISFTAGVLAALLPFVFLSYRAPVASLTLLQQAPAPIAGPVIQPAPSTSQPSAPAGTAPASTDPVTAADRVTVSPTAGVTVTLAASQSAGRPPATVPGNSLGPPASMGVIRLIGAGDPVGVPVSAAPAAVAVDPTAAPAVVGVDPTAVPSPSSTPTPTPTPTPSSMPPVGTGGSGGTVVDPPPTPTPTPTPCPPPVASRPRLNCPK